MSRSTFPRAERRRGPSPRARRPGFALRLVAALAGTLVAVAAVQYVVAGRQLEARLVRQTSQTYLGAAAAVEDAYSSLQGDEDAWQEVEEVVEVIAAFSGVESVAVIAPDDLAEGAALALSAADRAIVERALSQGTPYAGRHAADGDFEYVQVLNLGGEPAALRVVEDGTRLQNELRDLRLRTLPLVLVGLPLGLPLFWLLGGWALNRSHRHALDRSARDGLTGLGNHRAYQEEVRREVEIAKRRGHPLALAVVDLDDFKLVNDQGGHRRGDGVLVEVAQLLATGRPEDRAYRTGGDEFALVLPYTDTEGARRVLERLRKAVAERLGRVTISAGVAALGAEAQDAETLWECADAAMYTAKRRGRNAVVSFADLDEDLDIITPQKLTALRRLLDGGDVAAAFQPIWDLQGSRVLGFEALARMPVDSELGGPLEAFKVAERLGRVPDLDRLCRRAALVRSAGLPSDALLFINLAPAVLAQGRVAVDELLAEVDAAGLSPSRVVFEITERFEANREAVVRQAQRLREHGFGLALDDVGAGNAGLEMLRHVPVDFVKVDRDIVVGAYEDASARAVFLAIVAFAQEIDAFVIAEGIETDEVLAFVRRLELQSPHPRALVGGAQGYLLGRPSQTLAEPPSPLALEIDPPQLQRRLDRLAER